MNTNKNYFDLIVVGGGISGSVAAIAAARLGVKTLLVEQYGFLGGMLTAGGVGPMMTFHAGNKLVVQGITNEIIERLARNAKSPGHVFDGVGYTYTTTPFDTEAMKLELEEMLLEAGGKILYHAMLCGVEKNEELTAIKVCVRSDIISLYAKVFIDATGDANLAYLSKVPFTVGRQSDGKSQAMTTNIKMTNVDTNRIRAFMRDPENIEEFPRNVNDIAIADRSPKLSVSGFSKSIREACERGELSFKKGALLFFETNNPGEVIVNTTHVETKDPLDPWSFSEAETEGRRQAAEVVKFLIRRIPGFERAALVYTGPVQIGVRSSRQIIGLYTLNEEDLLNCVRFDDVVAHGGYHIDIHSAGKSEDFYKRKKFEMEWGETYSIPYRSLLNAQVKNLITVGRCISATYVAQGGIRVAPIAGAIGHAGGVAAAMAVLQKCLPQDINVKELQSNLIAQRAYLEV
jgi:ribulose 1,5-bisphosphate synthetase/thiazole synthase